MFKTRKLVGLVVLGGMSALRPAAADVVTDWNLIATQAVTQAGAARPGPSGLIDIAMVQLAMHDAMQALQGRFELYGGPITDPSGSPIAAVAKASRDVLIGVGLTATATDTIANLYTNYLNANSVASNDPGVDVGQQAAANILNLRANNTGAIPANAEQFFGGTGPGEWRPTSLLANGQPQPMVAAYLSKLLPFTLKDPSQFRQEPFPNLKSGKYAAEYNEVKSLGSLTGSARTPEQTDTALFFADNAVNYWNRTLRTLAGLYLPDSGDRAHMFALVNTAMADALITAWYAKRHFNFWRPITGIRLGDTDGNSRTVGEPTWTPYIPTPNYPDYTSGANNLSGSATTMLANYFGTDDVTFTMTSSFVHSTGALPTNPRTYHSFSAVADDVVEARIYEGIHFRSADEDARSEGKHVANWVFNHFLRPLH
jgi:hypothetical protein